MCANADGDRCPFHLLSLQALFTVWSNSSCSCFYFIVSPPWRVLSMLLRHMPCGVLQLSLLSPIFLTITILIRLFPPTIRSTIRSTANRFRIQSTMLRVSAILFMDILVGFQNWMLVAIRYPANCVAKVWTILLSRIMF